MLRLDRIGFFLEIGGSVESGGVAKALSVGPLCSGAFGESGKSKVPSENSITWPALANQSKSDARLVLACAYSELDVSQLFSPSNFAHTFSASCLRVMRG